LINFSLYKKRWKEFGLKNACCRYFTEHNKSSSCDTCSCHLIYVIKPKSLAIPQIY